MKPPSIFAVCLLLWATPAAAQQTSAIERITLDPFEEGRVSSPAALIEGRVAGVEVIEDGAPDGGVTIRIRGGSSITSAEPLYVVDGMPLSWGGGFSAGSNPLDFITVSDVESVAVVKGAAATARYGARGGNGVVLIDTRRGGSPRGLTYSGEVSAASALGETDLMDAAAFRDAVAAYDAAHGTDLSAELGDADTDWSEAVQRTGIGHQHAVGWVGGSSDATYRLSSSYTSRDGALRGSSSERATIGFGYEHALLSNRLHLRAHLHGARSDGAYTPAGVVELAHAMAPTQPIRDETGEYFEWDSPLAPRNPLAVLDGIDEEGTSMRGLGVIDARYDLGMAVPLSVAVRLGIDATSFERERTPDANESFRSRLDGGMASTLVEATLRHRRFYGVLELDVDAGVSRESNDSDLDFTSSVGSPPTSSSEWSITQDGMLTSLFAHADAALYGRYVVSLGLRSDAFSADDGCCGIAEGARTYPAAGIAWRISGEPFMSDFSEIGRMQLRASWGASGTDGFGRHLSGNTVDIGQALSRYMTGAFLPAPVGITDDFDPERVVAFDAGMDFGIAGDRVFGSVEYYTRTTENLAYPMFLGGPFGLAATNVGTLRNRGVEISLDGAILDGADGGLSWSASFDVTRQSSEITDLSVPGIFTGVISGGVANFVGIVQEGASPHAFYVYRRRADNPDFGDMDGDGVVELLDLYEDHDGNGMINEEDRRALGRPRPDWMIGHVSRMRWGAFDATFRLRAHLGNHIYNDGASLRGHLSVLTETGVPTNLHESVLETGFDGPQYFSDYYVEDASFLRMDVVSLGYTLPASDRVPRVRVFGTVHNAFTLTEYRGADVVAGVNGVDLDGRSPRARTAVIGANVAF